MANDNENNNGQQQTQQPKSSLEPDYYIVQFKKDRIDFFIDRNHIGLSVGDWVLVQAERGRDMGRIKSKTTKEMMERLSEHKYPLEILHKAKPQELEQLATNRSKEEEAERLCKEMIEFRGLEMKLIDVELQFDGNKLTFYFTAEHRVDFRELVKDLAAIFRTRIDLRQIGVRDETRKIGGLGPCGLELCCACWLKDFNPISTQYARNQNLAVNPGKLSGPCGRLFCCLDYEQNFYDDLLKKYPELDQEIKNENWHFKIEKIDPFKETINIVHIEDERRETITLDEYNERIGAKRKEWLEKWLPKGKGER